MLISSTHLKDFFNEDISTEEISKKLFQLGHENEINGDLIDFEITPNRGDCLSLKGIARELNVFYDISLDKEIFEGELPDLNLEFKNLEKDQCPKISFMHLEIDGEVKNYKPYFENYFKDLSIKKNNFFTDVSNYLSYEIGQPSHCYDFQKIGKRFELKEINYKKDFHCLTDKEIELSGANLVFLKNGLPINLAGVMGDLSTACNKNTKSVLVEFAYFIPEAVIGKSIKYDLNSEAGYKFERGTDPDQINYAIRRFIKIVEDHVSIKNLSLFNENHTENKLKSVEYNLNKVNKILGFDISTEEFNNYLHKLGFGLGNSEILIPSFRHDISSNNDIAEEVARLVGFDNLPIKNINIPKTVTPKANLDDKIRSFLIEKDFNEVINYPFSWEGDEKSIEIDNPLDKQKKFLRKSITESLIQNVLSNERRQQDSCKFFEISNIYFLNGANNKFEMRKHLALIVSGRKGKNFLDFSTFMDEAYIGSIFKELDTDFKFDINEVSRSMLDSKIKYPMFSMEIDIEQLENVFEEFIPNSIPSIKNIKFETISEFPLIKRDLSFQIFKSNKINDLVCFIENYNNNLLKETFMFDFYNDGSKNLVKIGFRFVFQSYKGTLTDSEVDNVIDDIVKSALKIKGVELPGYIKK